MDKIKKNDVTVVSSEGENIRGKHGVVVVALARGHMMSWTPTELPEDENWEDHYKFLFAQAYNDMVARKDEILAEQDEIKKMFAALDLELDEVLAEDTDIPQTAIERGEQIGLALVEDEVEPLPH